MPASDRPTIDTDSEAWWTAIQEGTLLVNVCGVCSRKSLYMRPFCPYCWSEAVSAVPASGHATLYTWTVIPPNATRTSIVVAMVDLAEGPRLMTNIENCAPEALEAGLELILDFRQNDDGFAVPVFTVKPDTPAPERN